MKTTRRTGIELLRIIAMFAIVLRHFISHSNGLTDSIAFNNPLVITEKAMVGFGFLSLNVFILITGYFMLEKPLDYNIIKSKLLSLWREVFGYSIVIVLITLFLFRVSIIEIIKSCFPIICYRYWFITTYFVLLLLVPIINRAFRNISKKLYKKTLIVLIVCFSLWQTFMPFVTTVDDMKGSSIIWFVTLYIVGGYIRKYGINILNNKLRIPVFFLMLFVFVIYTTVVEVVSGRTQIEVNIPCNNSIFALVASIALFNFFLKININGRIGRVISYLSGSVIAIYLISDNPLVRGILYNNILDVDKYINNGLKSILIILLYALVVFIVCLCIDILRRNIVEVFRKVLKTIKSEG